MSSTIVRVPTFPLVQVFVTDGVLNKVSLEEAKSAINRHFAADPKEVSDSQRVCRFTTSGGCRLLSIFQTEEGVSFWIVTEADGTTTTLFLPEEYAEGEAAPAEH